MARLIELLEHGQSPWLDFISRDLLESGGFRDLVEEGIRGATSNPTIFYKAVSSTDAYDQDVRDLLEADPQASAPTLYDWITIEDVRRAADVLRPVYESSKGDDGYVSLEVSPYLAYDTEDTIEAARHLWTEVARPNLMIKVPATEAGIPAIEQLIAEGINVNATLLFSVKRYEEVARAYIRGVARQTEPRRVASVASFFVSRVDTKVDALLERIGTPEAQALKGKIAVANAKMAYQKFKAIFHGEDFAAQRRRNARVQRPLWASTGTKNPAYSDVLYVENLIGAETVTTLPMETLDAFLAHGEAMPTLEMKLEEAERHLNALARLGIDLDQVTDELEKEGVQAFKDSYDQLIELINRKRFEVTRV